jgi:hypothetical protein
LPSPKTWAWPTTLSKVCGRIRSAKGTLISIISSINHASVKSLFGDGGRNSLSSFEKELKKTL